MKTKLVEHVILKDRECPWELPAEKFEDKLLITKSVYATDKGTLVEYSRDADIDCWNTYWLNGERIGLVVYKCDSMPLYDFFGEHLEETLQSVGLYLGKYGTEFVFDKECETEWHCKKSLLTLEEEYEMKMIEERDRFEREEMDKWMGDEE